MKNKFQIFGSPSSQDLDVMIFVDFIPELPNEAHDLCKVFDKELEVLLKPTKIINSNLCVINSAVVTHTHKGTEDEVNNALYDTYSYHDQLHQNQITGLYDRDPYLKYIRTARVLLSLISRTRYRTEVKKALKGNIFDKLNLIKEIDYSLIVDLGKKKDSFEDYVKILAFQVGQSLGLMEDIELYTKEDIWTEYPDLKPCLMRDTNSLGVLQEYMKYYVMNALSIFENSDYDSGKNNEYLYEYSYRNRYIINK